MSCPDREQLRAFLRGEGDTSLKDHVESCPHCQKALQDFGTLEDADVRQAAQLPSLPTSATEPPRLLGAYELLRLLGSGGQAEVWLARHVLLDCVRAVKMLRPDRQGREALERFLREMKLYARLNHPNIVAIKHAEMIDGQPILVMEYVAGKSLHQLVEAHQPLNVATACGLVRQAAVGLQHAHENGIVHRDIKPGNLMLDKTLTVKVLDFGLARGGLATTGGEPLTLPSSTFGTPEFMAPEQPFAAEQVDIRADLYSLGCTLFCLLTGSPPYPAERYPNVMGIFDAHRGSAVPSIRERRPDVHEALANLIEKKLLAKKPEDRLQTPAHLVTALGQFAQGHNLGPLLGVTAPALEGAGSRPGVPATLPSDIRTPLDAALELVFWNADEKCRMMIDEPGVLPVKEGDEFRVEVRLNRPGFVYLIWIDSEGNVTPVHPWSPGSDWEPTRSEEAVAEVRLPVGGEGEVWPIRGPAGIETLVLLARDQPLSADEHTCFPGWLPARFPRLASLPDPARPRWLIFRQEEGLAAEAGVKGFDPRPRAPVDPLFQLDSLLRERLGPRFQLVYAVSFTNLGPKGAQS